MSRTIDETKRVAVVRVVRAAYRRATGRVFDAGRKRHFKLGEQVRSLTQVKNDGTYPHRDIGEVIVCQGDVGRVRESWSFLGEVYYTVEFASRAVVVIMRGGEMERSASP
jgi:nitrogen fixation protein NifZ